MAISPSTSPARPRRVIQRTRIRIPHIHVDAGRVRELPTLPNDVINEIIGCGRDDKRALATWMRVSTVAKVFALTHMLSNVRLSDSYSPATAFYLRPENVVRIKRLILNPVDEQWEPLRGAVRSLVNVTVLEITRVPVHGIIRSDYFEAQRNTVTTLILNEVRFPSYWGLSQVISQFPDLRSLELWDCHWPELLDSSCALVEPKYIGTEKKEFPDPWQMNLKTLRIQSRYPDVVNAYARSIIGDRKSLTIQTLEISCPCTVKGEEPYFALISLSSPSLHTLRLSMSQECRPGCITSEELSCLPCVIMDEFLNTKVFTSLVSVHITVAPGELDNPQEDVQEQMQSLVKRGVTVDVEVKEPSRLIAFPCYVLGIGFGRLVPLGPGNRVEDSAFGGRGLWGL